MARCAWFLPWVGERHSVSAMGLVVLFIVICGGIRLWPSRQALFTEHITGARLVLAVVLGSLSFVPAATIVQVVLSFWACVLAFFARGNMKDSQLCMSLFCFHRVYAYVFDAMLEDASAHEMASLNNSSILESVLWEQGRRRQTLKADVIDEKQWPGAFDRCDA